MLIKKTKTAGAALISALLIMTLTASVATLLAINLQTQIRQANLIQNSDQAFLAAQLVENWSIATLIKADKLKRANNLPQILYYLFPTTKIKNITISGFLLDQQGLFNINSLTNTDNQIYFVRLLKAVDTKISDTTATQIAIAVTDWVLPAAEEKHDVYLDFKPAYRAAHRPMVSISELRLVAGINARRYQLLKPYLVALPTQIQNKSLQINVNSAPAAVFMSLADGITYDVAQTIIAKRKAIGGFKSVGEFINYLAQLNIQPDKSNPFNNVLTVQSSYFLATAYAQTGQQQLTLYSVLQSNAVDDPMADQTGFQVIRRTRGDY